VPIARVAAAQSAVTASSSPESSPPAQQAQ
jgi:hypothetical protein